MRLFPMHGRNIETVHTVRKSQFSRQGNYVAFSSDARPECGKLAWGDFRAYEIVVFFEEALNLITSFFALQ